MHYRYILFIVLCLFTTILSGQTKKVDKDKKVKTETPVELANKIYVDNIRTVKFHPKNLPTSEPVVNLNSSTQLILRFDDVDLDVKDYEYTIQHYNRDWTPNEELNSFDYLIGFDEEILQDYAFSRTRYSDYIHYSLVIPNERVKWKLSGNYVLKIFDTTDEKKLCLTRRFMVIDHKTIVRPEVRTASAQNQYRSHQEIDFTIEFDDDLIQGLPGQMTASVVQNGVWNKSILNIKPLFVKQKELSFNYMNKIVFEAGKEYRFVDIRSLRYRLNFVEKIEELDQGFDLLVKKEVPRAYKNYFNSPDADGKFVIQNFDDISFRRLGNEIQIDTIVSGREGLTEQQIQDRLQLASLVDEINLKDLERARQAQHVSAEYVLTYFTLDAPQPYFGGEVYIFGELSDYRIDKSCLMRYNSEALQYEAEIMLKQGYYNYMYVFQPDTDKGTQKFSLEEVEGNWFETDNSYQIFLYDRPFGQRYDELIGYKSFSQF